MIKKKEFVYNEQYADLRYTEPIEGWPHPTWLGWMYKSLLVLRDTTYEDYCAKEKEERLEKPWRKQLIDLANKIVVNAKYYGSITNTNEAEWRQLDEDIFCRYKNIIDWIGRFGINDELHSRLETLVRDEFGQCKRPDRIHGIRLPQERKIIPAIHNINAHPYAKTAKGTPLFPYLVHEAKSVMSSSTLANLEHQMKLPIRAFLRAQESLKTFNGPQSTWQEGPLVWVVTNWGNVWEISAAYIDKTKEKDKKYVVNSLWLGNVTKQDDALQLLLILDYILDWAIDVYRPTILNELQISKKLVHPETETQLQEQAVKSREEQAIGRISSKPRRKIIIPRFKLPKQSEFSPDLDFMVINMSKNFIKHFDEMSSTDIKQGLESGAIKIGKLRSRHDPSELKKGIGSTASNSSSENAISDVLAPTSTYKKTYNLRSGTKQVTGNTASVSVEIASKTSDTGSLIFSDTKDDISTVKLEAEHNKS